MEEKKVQEKSDKDKIADLIVENQVMRHKATILAELAYGLSNVLKYYAETRLTKPVFLAIEPNEGQAIYSKAKYKVVEVVDNAGPDKEFLVGMEIYDMKFDVQTADNAYNEIFRIFKELDIELVDDEAEEKVEEKAEEVDGQLHLDFENSIEE